MSDLTDIRHVAKSRKEDLIDLGYDDIEAVMEANPDDLTSLSRVGENKAMEMIVSAENLAEDTESDSDTDTSESSESENTSADNSSDELSDEMKMKNMTSDNDTEVSSDEESNTDTVTEVVDTDVISTHDVSDIEAVTSSEEVYSLNLDLNAEQHLILLHALYKKYLHLQSRDRSRAEDCHYLAQAYSAHPESVLVNCSHLNTLFDVLREEKITYQSKYYEDELPLCIDLFEQVVEFRDSVL
jgi:hypothetical protein